MLIAIYAAMSQNRIIGRDNTMPWDVPDGYRCFLRCIDGQTVIVGRKTWDAFGEQFTSSHTIVLTHQEGLDGVETATSFDDALAKARAHHCRVFIAGGGSIYRQALDSGAVDEIYLTVVNQVVDGDTTFPELDDDTWRLIQRKRHPDYVYLHYRNVARLAAADADVPCTPDGNTAADCGGSD